jgi:hypothetical protein
MTSTIGLTVFCASFQSLLNEKPASASAVSHYQTIGRLLEHMTNEYKAAMCKAVEEEEEAAKKVKTVRKRCKKTKPEPFNPIAQPGRVPSPPLLPTTSLHKARPNNGAQPAGQQETAQAPNQQQSTAVEQVCNKTQGTQTVVPVETTPASGQILASSVSAPTQTPPPLPDLGFIDGEDFDAIDELLRSIRQ